jgi:hypothetical protein
LNDLSHLANFTFPNFSRGMQLHPDAELTVTCTVAVPTRLFESVALNWKTYVPAIKPDIPVVKLDGAPMMAVLGPEI